jgi:hypothetical protein
MAVANVLNVLGTIGKKPRQRFVLVQAGDQSQLISSSGISEEDQDKTDRGVPGHSRTRGLGPDSIRQTPIADQIQGDSDKIIRALDQIQ